MNAQGLGKRQRQALEFIERVNGWHTYAKDVAGVIRTLERRGLVETNQYSQFRLMVPIKCDQCEMLSINGVACHEQGCPNTFKTWENGEWVKYVKCFECGCDVRQGSPCCGEEVTDELV